MNLKKSYQFVLKSVKKDVSLVPALHSLRGKTYVISGGTRGIGLAIGKSLATMGANIVLLGKTQKPHPKLEGTLDSAAEEVQRVSASTHHQKVLPLFCDIRNHDSITEAINKVINTYDGIDGALLNASALCLRSTLDQTKKEVDLMSGVNINGTFLMGQACLQHIQKKEHGHVLTISPPLSMLDEHDWWTPHLYYSMSKFNMTLMARTWGKEFPHVGVNTLWPRTTIDTAPVRNLLGGAPMVSISRKPEIMGDAAKHIFLADPRLCTNKNFIDDEVLASLDIDVEKYRVDTKITEKELMPDFFC
jgi:citronellol/citronellal dehydrogenase